MTDHCGSVDDLGDLCWGLLLFLKAGPVKNIHFPKGPDGTPHKGYCFVQFYHNSSVPYTMELMQGATMFGKKLKLQPRPGSIHRKVSNN